MLTIEQADELIEAYRGSLCSEIDAGGLLARNCTAHKWKVTYRTIILRELVSWRFVDLLQQAILLEKSKGFVGSRILIRSAIETLSVLIYCVRKMENIVRTGEGFHEYGQKTVNLLLGSRDQRTKHNAINVLEVTKLASKQYPELQKAYDELSETAHPNFEGMMNMYSIVSDRGMNTKFTNDASQIYERSQLSTIAFLCLIFEHEYNDAWSAAFEKFEAWTEANDASLEASKPSAGADS